MSCLKFAAFYSDYEKCVNFDIILCRLNCEKFYVSSVYRI